ncbi:U32 family peptidase [Treponema ruminis]|uniref:Putative protease n=1 Tax=Treponema ruminis TaxID=744515 RepID=A0A7W8GA07_9SPIR|nr:peptidase U32 family protein [Treponema ruminis]MBB5226495.1 putative protease [Treponema ruminis]QSI02601.1 U32 family peptidase [Treponema ruminis]
MELVCPAGNIDKLSYAYAYGADTAYIGLKRFSLRIKADNFYEDEYKRVIELKKKYPQKRLFCALNIAFHNHDLKMFMQNLDYFKQYPIDAFIVQDLGMVPILQKEFPGTHLHLSTQASCMNKEAVKMYHSLGFKRVVLGREVSLDEIREIKDACPEMELECFAHGAMCIAYSGRCLMSAYLTGRSAQSGFCSHSCRWEYDLGVEKSKLNLEGGKISAEAAKEIAQSGILRLQERQRPGEFFPVFEGDDFTAILSSKDLCMIDHLADMKKAGVDAIKVEGRMKSTYYVAMVARAYRKALDALEGKISAEEAAPFIASLDDVAHREATTGFYYNRGDADKTTIGASDSPYLLAAAMGNPYSDQECEKILAAGQKLVADRQAELAAMHPNAREAVLRDLEQHPEKVIKTVEKREGWKVYPYDALNRVDAGTELEFVSPSVLGRKVSGSEYDFINPKTGEKLDWVNADHDCAIYTGVPVEENTLVRVKDPEYVEGEIRDYGR